MSKPTRDFGDCAWIGGLFIAADIFTNGDGEITSLRTV